MEPLRLRAALTALGLAAGLALVAEPAAAQATGTVRGRVVQARTERPLSGAQVHIPGTGRGTLTTAGGQFLLLNVPAGTHTLRVEMLGHGAAEQQVTVAVGQAAVANFALTETAIDLDEVVVTGTAGGMQKRAIGNVVAQIRAEETVDKALVPNIQGLINGRAPNVVIMPGTGMVGSGAKIRIRGANSLSLTNEPLLYVDGIRVDNASATGPDDVQDFGSRVISRLNDFNPDDIESIEVIKGPAAATLYGTEAANGVIQIITKKGHVGRPRFNFLIRQGVNQFANAEERVWTNYWRNPATGQVETLNLVESENARGTPLWTNGHTQNYSASVSGGSEAARYYFALDYDDEEGVEPTNQLQRFAGRANISVYPHEKFDLTGSLGYITSSHNLPCEAGCGGTTWGAFFSTPRNLDANLDLTRNPPRRGYRSNTSDIYWMNEFSQDLGRFTGSLQLNYRPFSWLTQRLNVGTDEVREDNQEFYPLPETDYQRLFLRSATGRKTVDRRDVSVNTVDYSGTVNANLRPTISSATSVGAQYYRRLGRFVTATGREFVLPGLRAINAAGRTEAGETYAEDISFGVFLQQQFGWKDRLFVTGAIRADDHSAFGENFDLVYYPKAQATWVISEEPFFDFGFVNTLRLRTAYGQSGTQPRTFDALRTFEAALGPADRPTVTPDEPGNPDLGPMRASELELGFDASLLEERIGLELTYYASTIKDDILQREAPPSEGFPGSQFINLGEHHKDGLELLLTGRAWESRNLAVELTFTGAMNNSEVKDLGDNDVVVESSAFGVEHRVGSPLGSWFHYELTGAQLDEKGAFIRSSLMCATPGGGSAPCYEGSRLVAEPVYLGRTIPKWEGSLSSTITLFDNIRLYGLVDFKADYSKWDHNLRVRCGLFEICRENVLPLEGDPVTVAYYQNGARFGAAYINDASFAKLREVSLTYTLPAHLTQPFGLSRAGVTLAARNLKTWTNWSGMEPEAMYLGGARGGHVQLEQNNLPQLRQFVTTINVSF